MLLPAVLQTYERMSDIDYLRLILLVVFATGLIGCLLMILIQALSKNPIIRNVPGTFMDLYLGGVVTKLYFLTGRSAHRFHSLHQSYGGIARFAPGQATTNTLQALRTIYGSTQINKGAAFLKTSFYKNISRTNIFTASDPKYHASVRKLFGQSFTPGKMQAHNGVIQACVSRLHAAINERLLSSTASTIKLNNLLYCHSVDTVSEVLLGKPLGCLKRGKPYFWTEILPRIFYWATIRSQFQGSGIPTMIRWMLRHLLRKGVRSRNEDARMRLIREQLNAPHVRRDVMVEVMERATDLPLHEIEENFSAIMLAGFHTTQNALCAAIYLVLTHGEVHRALVDELQTAFGVVGSAEKKQQEVEVSGEVAQQLPYLNAVINEALRIYPPVPMGPPRVSSGTWVEGVYIPAGTEICTSIYALHHNAEYFAHPDEFMPQRWLEGGSTDKKEAAQPFLVGNRSCIAKYFAKQMLQITLAGFFLEYDAEYVGRVRDWQQDSRCYAFWELPELELKISKRGN
ncbi:hypothetical protein FE257_007071 [Aspergillus nanangensis]|uniref:Cytochrome P450 monooxygenase n=1 Tax=Aspergillus nanangensis TaxID=2582783 RepID=A0AAD4GUK7_ASPNN|nr:hypothetical protein FE257_007071 [Aspergillus nanangensis]